MKFSRKKLPKDAIQTLRRVPVELYEAHRNLLTPVYVFLPKNQKFVALKAPLQHFSPSELEKFKSYDNFYVPEFIEQITPFQRAGELMHSFLAVYHKQEVETNQGKEWVHVPVSQNERDNAVLGVLGRLWSRGAKVEPFFLCFFVDEFCPPLAIDKMMPVIEKDADLFELALLRSSAAVFLALHIGYTDSNLLFTLRDQAFEDTVSSNRLAGPGAEIGQMIKLVRKIIETNDTREISFDGFQKIIDSPVTHFSDKVAIKMRSRLKRIKLEFIGLDSSVSSLYGDMGLIDD